MATIEREVQIEAASSDSIDEVMGVMEQAFDTSFGEAWTRSQLGGILPMGGVSLMLARAGDETIGFSLVRSVADEAELLLIAVAPDHRRRGVGRRMLDDFLERARNDGIARVHLEVRDGNPAVAMSRSAGCSPVGRRRNYYRGDDGKRFDAITLAIIFR
jgi:ribosomal-protein-alanine N-acetyltransferase